MSKINLKQFPKHMQDAIERSVNETLTPKLMQEIGDDFAEQIRIRTRLGNGLDQNGGEPKKLKPLSPAYIEDRKSFEGLSELTKPSKSNLTRTGQMLTDLIAKVQDLKITLTFKTNESKDKARWTSEDRPFLYVSRVQIERLKNNLEKKIAVLLKKYL